MLCIGQASHNRAETAYADNELSLLDQNVSEAALNSLESAKAPLLSQNAAPTLSRRVTVLCDKHCAKLAVIFSLALVALCIYFVSSSSPVTPSDNGDGNECMEIEGLYHAVVNQTGADMRVAIQPLLEKQNSTMDIDPIVNSFREELYNLMQARTRQYIPQCSMTTSLTHEMHSQYILWSLQDTINRYLRPLASLSLATFSELAQVPLSMTDRNAMTGRMMDSTCSTATKLLDKLTGYDFGSQNIC